MGKHLRSCVTILMYMLVAGDTTHAQVIISEIMYNPAGADFDETFNKEWVEIFNTGTATVDLGGWTFEDIQDSEVASPIPGGTLLAPGHALVLTGDLETFDSEWGGGINRIELEDFPVLANGPSATNETIAIKNSFGVVQDAVNHDDENDWPTDIVNGPSIYVLPEFLTPLGNNFGTNWQSSTPGIDGAVYNPHAPSADRGSPGIVATEPTNFPPFAPSPDAAWSMVVFGDTQNYVKAQAHMPLFFDMSEWVRDNREEFNIQVVLQEGDLVNRNSDENPSTGENPATLQWQNAQAAMSILNGEVPYVLAVGNHDVGIGGEDLGPTRLNEFFSASDNPLNDPAQGGILKGVQQAGHLDNAYYELTTPDGRDLLIVSVAWDAQPQTINWANQVVGQSKFEDHTAMLLVHSYLGNDGNRYGYGEELWEDLVKENENFEFVFNGHVGGDGTGYLRSTGDEGNQVHQMLFNTQFEGNGGNGWLRVIEFLEDGKTVRVRTYSPTFGYVREDVENAFTFEISELNFDPADFDRDGDVDGDDLIVWNEGLGIAVGASWNDGDADEDGDVDGNDFLQWQRSLGTTVASVAANSAGVPEPMSWSIAIVGAMMSFASRWNIRNFSRLT